MAGIKDLPAELHQRSLAKEPERAAEPPTPFRGRFALTQELLDQARAEPCRRTRPRK